MTKRAFFALWSRVEWAGQSLMELSHGNVLFYILEPPPFQMLGLSVEISFIISSIPLLTAVHQQQHNQLHNDRLYLEKGIVSRPAVFST